MNVKELIDSAAAESDDRAAGQATAPADRLRYLNEAVDEACIRRRLLFEASNTTMCQIPIDVGQQAYPLNDAWLYITKVQRVDEANPLEYCDMRIRTRDDLDLEHRHWRTDTSCKPFAVIVNDTTIEVCGIIAGAGTLYLEGYRLPLAKLVKSDDKPEIHRVHHPYLTQWMLHRMYAVPDREIFNTDKSLKALAAFEAYFGRRPDADQRKGMQADPVHHNRAWWI